MVIFFREHNAKNEEVNEAVTAAAAAAAAVLSMRCKHPTTIDVKGIDEAKIFTS